MNCYEILTLLPERIASRIRIGTEDSCWLWSGCCNEKGYALARLEGGTVRVARLVLETKLGRKLGKHEETRHTCDIRPCCNPNHLEVGSHVDNILDRTERGRAARGASHGSRLHPERLAWGSRHGQAKLSEEKVRQIFELRSQGLKQREIAVRFGCSRENVGRILRGERWKRVVPNSKQVPF